ncbi:MAG TPA: class I SAM-dependent methyltransferase [Terriglobia bacterium]|nr:class I SAM-dependent methyltransferase [Terriglobia bacterium]
MLSRLGNKLTLGLLFALCAGSLASADTPKQYKGRAIAPVMSAEGADWLTREDRETYEQPERVLDSLKIVPGTTVADIGAGVGYFSLRIAKRVGLSGKVVAVDVQPKMLELLKTNRDRERLSNIELVLGTETDPRLSPQSVDLILMVDVYHEFQYPEEMMAGIHQALRPNGRLVLVEYRGEDPTVPIKPEHKMTVQQVLKEIEPMGFRLKEKLDFLPWQHILIFEKEN